MLPYQIEPSFETIFNALGLFELSAGQFEECLADLKKENVREIVLVNDEHGFHAATHA